MTRASKRFLIMAADFAPRGASPAVRTVHLVKYLQRAGHHVNVITYDEATQTVHSPYDAGLVEKVPDAVDVARVGPGVFHRFIGRAKTRGADAEGLRRKGTKSSLSSLIIPDPHVAAVGSFVRAAERVIANEAPDVLLTFCYPFSMNIVGAWLKRRHRDMVWIADYGDPWTGGVFSELSRPGWRRAVDRRLERRLLGNVDAVTVTTYPTRNLYERQFESLAGKVHVMPMGFDPEDVRDVAPEARGAEQDGKVVMVHAGRIWKARNPFPFIDAVAGLVEKDPSIAKRLKIVFLGDADPPVLEAVARSRASEVIEIRARVPVRDSIAAMKSADVLLLFGNRGGIQVPGKLYEYMGVARPILLLQECDHDPVVGLLDEYGGRIVVANEAAAIADQLEETLSRGLPAVNRDASSRYGWDAISHSLVGIAEQASSRLGT